MPVTWTAINDGLSGDALNVYRFLHDPWSSNGTTLTGAYLATKGGIYKTSTLPTPTWTQVLSAATLAGIIGANDPGYPISQFTRELVPSILVKDYIGIVAQKSLADGTRKYFYVYSADGGATWSANTSYYWCCGPIINWAGNLVDADGAVFIFAWPSHKVANTIYMSLGVKGADGTPSHGKGLVKSTDGGATWGAATDWDWGTSNGQRYIVLPFANSAGTPYADDSKAWKFHVGQSDKEIMTSTSFPGPGFSDRDTWTVVHALDSNVFSWLGDINTWNENYVYVLTVRAPGGASYVIVYTNDGGATWDTKTLPHVTELQALSALPYDPHFCAVATGITDDGAARVYRTLDGGATFVEATGDLNTVLPGIGDIRSIVPDWIKTT